MKRRLRKRGGRQGSPSWRFTFTGGRGDLPDAAAPADRSPEDVVFSLSQGTVGERLWVTEFLSGRSPQGLRVGDEIEILSCSPSGSVVVAVRDEQLGFCGDRAQAIRVSREPLSITDQGHPLKQLRHLNVGAAGRILGYDCPHRGYRKRLLAMGLTPGTEFTVTRHAPLGDPVEICVRGFSLSLRKDEACALLVEAVEE